jgi:hypothetical protein
MMFFWAQAIGFQLLWFNAILGQNQWLLLGIGLLLCSVAFSPKRNADLKLWPLALVGLAGDALLTLTGVFVFEQFPLWLGTIWLGFVFTLNHSMLWLQRLQRPFQAMIGAIAGTLSYLAGARLGAVDLPNGQGITALVLAAYWAALLPGLLMMSRRLTATGTPS